MTNKQEIERKVEMHTQVSINAYDKGYEQGRLAEQKRIYLEWIDWITDLDALDARGQGDEIMQIIFDKKKELKAKIKEEVA